MIAKKYKYNNRNGNWYGKGTVKHITTDNWNTMCGIHIGSSDEGWWIYDFPDGEATCKKCKKVMKNYGRE